MHETSFPNTINFPSILLQGKQMERRTGVANRLMDDEVNGGEGRKW